jgi:hypothetical protein
MNTHIKNPAAFNQFVDFSTFAVQGQDVDFDTDFSGEVFVRVEIKNVDAGLSDGQAISANHWVEALGDVAFAFFVVAEHQVPTHMAIEGENLMVREVFFKLPHMPRSMTVEYEVKRAPMFNQFISNLAFICGQARLLLNENALPLDPLWFFDPVLCAAYDTELSQHRRGLAARRLQNSFPPTLGVIIPPDLRSSAEQREAFRAWFPDGEAAPPPGWEFVQRYGEPSHRVL